MPNDGTGLTATPGTTAGDGDEAKAALVYELAGQLRDDFRKRDDLLAAISTVIFQEDAIEIPQAYAKTALALHSPLPLHIPNTAAAALSTNDPTVHFNPVGRGTAGENNATLREHFFEASWRRQEEESDRQLFRSFMWSLIAYGEGVLKTIPRKRTAWAEYARRAKSLKGKMASGIGEYADLDEDSKDRIYDTKTEAWKQGAPYPIMTTDVPADTFYRLQTLDGISVACEIQELPYFDALERFNAGLDKSGNVVSPQRDPDGKILPEAVGLPRSEWSAVMGRTRTITCIELWKWDTVTYVLCGPNQGGGRNGKLRKGTFVREVKHKYGNQWTKTLRGPYFHALGITTSSRLPERAGLGILTPFLELFPQINACLSIAGNSAFMTGFPAYSQTTPPGAEGPANPYGKDDPTGGAPVRIVPGEILPFGVAPIEQPRGGVDLDKFHAQLRSLVEMALPSVLQGAAGSSDSGYEFNQKAHMARLAWDPLVGNAEAALQRRTGFESWLLEHDIKERVYVWSGTPDAKQERKTGRGSWLSINGKDDLDGVHTYTVKLDPETPSNKLLEQRYWEAMVRAGFASHYQAINGMGGNPDEVEEQELLWEMKRDPAVREQLKTNIFKALGTMDQKLLMGQRGQVDLTQAPPGGPPGQPGQPSDRIGNVTAPGIGMPMVPPLPGGAMPPGPLSQGNPPGMPVAPGPPQGHLPLPGGA